MSKLERSQAFFEAAEGRSLFRRAWLPPAPKACVVVAHGLGEHSGRCEAVGSWLAEQGYAVHAFDCWGHGHSPGQRAHVERFDAFADDLQRLSALVSEEHAGLPQVLLGHSMGGLVILRTLLRHRPAVAGAVLSGAALDLSISMPPVLLWGARVMRRVLPRMSVDNNIDPEWLSRDPEVVRRYLEDPLVYQQLTFSLAAELGEAARDTVARGSELDVPVLAMHGGDDRICAPEGSERFCAGSRSSHCKLLIYPGLRHELFHEPESEQVFQDMHEWMMPLVGTEAQSARSSMSPA